MTDSVDPAQVEQRLRSGTHGLMDAIYSVPGMTSRNVLIVIDQFEEIFRFGDTSQRSLSELERTHLHDDALAFVASPSGGYRACTRWPASCSASR